MWVQQMMVDVAPLSSVHSPQAQLSTARLNPTTFDPAVIAAVNLPGYYYALGSGGDPQALPCPVDTYQPGLRKQRACVPCPPGYTSLNRTMQTNFWSCGESQCTADDTGMLVLDCIFLASFLQKRHVAVIRYCWCARPSLG